MSDRRGMTPEGPLEGVRVVEIGDFGEVAGKLLADAGADVVRVEPPEGARSRHIGPFVGDEAGVDRSLSFAARNTSKRSVTLDLRSEADRVVWRSLVRWAEVVIDSSGVGVLDEVGCGHQAAATGAADERVWCSLTPFGLSGPQAEWPWVDLVSMALGGPVMSTGYEDHELPPIRPDGEHSIAISNEYAVSSILAALWMRGGQLVDVSAHEAVSATTEGSFPNWEFLGKLVTRQTGRHAAPQWTSPWQYQCADGQYVLLMGGGVPREMRVWRRLLEWMDEHGLAGDLHDPVYAEVLYRDPTLQPDARAHVAETIGRFVVTLDSEVVYRRAQALHLPWAPVRRPEENLADPHWDDRSWWWEGEAPGFDGTVRYAGAPYRFTDSPVRMRRRPPLLGEHNDELRAELEHFGAE